MPAAPPGLAPARRAVARWLARRRLALPALAPVRLRSRRLPATLRPALAAWWRADLQPQDRTALSPDEVSRVRPCCRERSGAVRDEPAGSYRPRSGRSVRESCWLPRPRRRR